MKTFFICEKCSYSSPKWLGKCPACNNWNSFIEEIEEKLTKSKTKGKNPIQTTSISTIATLSSRIQTNIGELDRVLGGGIVSGNIILLAGEPGIGKSTLTLQICDKLCTQNKSVLYISGEESVEQISLRAHRLDLVTEKLKLLNCTDFESIIATIEAEKPDCLVIDSVQVINSSNLPSLPGSIGQVRYCTEQLMNYGKKNQTPIFIVGHVTKEGNLAGPKVLEHLVDTVLLFEGDRFHDLRILRNLKHRFGPTNEIGIFEMQEKGLKEVKNPSASFVEDRNINTVGSCLTCILEGNRPLLLEIQALTAFTNFGYPKRTTSGFDLNRLHLIIAVLQKYCHLNLNNQDVFLNVTGGISINDPSADLAVALSIFSSLKQQPLPLNSIFIGEIGLTGTIRKVTHLEKRLKESKKFNLIPFAKPQQTLIELLQSISTKT